MPDTLLQSLMVWPFHSICPVVFWGRVGLSSYPSRPNTTVGGGKTRKNPKTPSGIPSMHSSRYNPSIIAPRKRLLRDAMLKKDSIGVNSHERWTVDSLRCPYRTRTYVAEAVRVVNADSCRQFTYRNALYHDPSLKSSGQPRIRRIRRVDCSVEQLHRAQGLGGSLGSG